MLALYPHSVFLEIIRFRYECSVNSQFTFITLKISIISRNFAEERGEKKNLAHKNHFRTLLPREESLDRVIYRKIRHERRRPFSSGESVNALHGPYSYITRNELSPWSIIRQAV